MYSQNRIFLTGHVGNVEVKTINDKRVASFSIATSESWKDKNTGERKERTQWHRCQTWKPSTVDLIERHISKGDYLHVQGLLEYREFETQAGEKRTAAEIRIAEIGFLQRKPDASDHAGTSDLDDDIPF